VSRCDQELSSSPYGSPRCLPPTFFPVARLGSEIGRLSLPPVCVVQKKMVLLRPTPTSCQRDLMAQPNCVHQRGMGTFRGYQSPLTISPQRQQSGPLEYPFDILRLESNPRSVRISLPFFQVSSLLLIVLQPFGGYYFSCDNGLSLTFTPLGIPY